MGSHIPSVCLLMWPIVLQTDAATVELRKELVNRLIADDCSSDEVSDMPLHLLLDLGVKTLGEDDKVVAALHARCRTVLERLVLSCN